MTEIAARSSIRVLKILGQAKALAVEYYELTGRPLGLTGEVAEFEAARILGLELSAVRQSGYDAIRRTPGGVVRLQIKGRCSTDPTRSPVSASVASGWPRSGMRS